MYVYFFLVYSVRLRRDNYLFNEIFLFDYKYLEIEEMKMQTKYNSEKCWSIMILLRGVKKKRLPVCTWFK